ncbi:MAG: hypothetical protein JSV89_06315 [Spirochaetaceae bacterium]|nr:MAG: hypothetical protein JSV89_06315 [Spirochaetaceae bacterium]
MTEEPVSEDQAEALAWLITDPTNGLTQEVADLGSYLFGMDGSIQSVAPRDSTVESIALGLTESCALYFCGALGGFTWNPDTQAYEKELSDLDISLPNRDVHLDRLFVRVRFHTSADASGDSFQPVEVKEGVDLEVAYDGATSTFTYSGEIRLCLRRRRNPQRRHYRHGALEGQAAGGKDFGGSRIQWKQAPVRRKLIYPMLSNAATATICLENSLPK